jgi:hypothetical protein
VIKYFPGLKQFVKERAPAYDSSRLTVQAFSQPPNFNFYSKSEDAYEQVTVPGDVTAEQVEAMLATWGITAGSGAQKPADVSDCEAEL